MFNDNDVVDYDTALENVLATGLFVTVAHRNKDATALYQLLNELVEAYDIFNEMVDQLPDAEFEDEEEDEVDHHVNLLGEITKR